MNNQNSTADVEVVYDEEEMLDESVHHNTGELVREINRLKREVNRLRQ
jgi:hypothetical protein